jgi:hypothetical protein
VRVLGVLVGAALALVPTGASGHAAGDPGHYRGFGDAGGFLDVLPPGQEGNLDATELAAAQAANASGTSDPTAYPRHFADQRALYDSLLFHGSTLSDTDLTRYFKDASFGVAADDIGRTYHPRADVTVVRDRSSGVAHIFGRTRYATMFAEGYTTAEDRLLMMDVLRHLGRGRLSELTGPAGLDIDRRTVTESPYTEADLAGQLRRLRESGSLGRAVVDDLDAYADGVNRFLAEAAADPAKLPAEYGLLGRRPERWRTTDSVAVAADIGAILG